MTNNAYYKNKFLLKLRVFFFIFLYFYPNFEKKSLSHQIEEVIFIYPLKNIILIYDIFFSQ
jgi:hypothetical protein